MAVNMDLSDARNIEDSEVKKINEKNEKIGMLPASKSKGRFGARHVLGIMGFWGFASTMSMRMNVSVALVVMVNSSAIPHVNSTSPDACPNNIPNSPSHKTQDGEFEWNEKDQAMVLSSFFWGYLITNPISGWFSDVIGGKIVFGAGVLISSIMSIITPVAAYTSFYLVIAVQMVNGLGQGLMYPAIDSLFARWVPVHERSRMCSFVFAGPSFGITVFTPLLGLLCHSSFLGGWPAGFYLIGSLGVVHFTVWMVLIHNDPSSHPYIHPDERMYIQQSLQQNAETKKIPPFPVLSVLTSLPFWAIIFAHVGYGFGVYTLLCEIPTYVKHILHFDIVFNSLVSGLPALMMCITSISMGHLSDYLIIKGVLSTTNTRRLMNSIGTYGPMVCIVLVGYSGCNRSGAVVLLCLVIGLNGANNSGFFNSHLDISPNFAGTLMGLTNCLASVSGIIGPLITGALINGEQTVERWSQVFWMIGVVYFVCNTFYVIFITSEKQPWNDPPDSNSNCDTQLPAQCQTNKTDEGATTANKPYGTVQTTKVP